MTFKPSAEQEAATRAQFGDSLGAAKKKTLINVLKDKKSQAIDAVSNVVVIQNDITKLKYAIALNATVTRTDKQPVIDEDPYLAELQEAFCAFLKEIKADVISPEITGLE